MKERVWSVVKGDIKLKLAACSGKHLDQEMFEELVRSVLRTVTQKKAMSIANSNRSYMRAVFCEEQKRQQSKEEQERIEKELEESKDCLVV